MTQWTKHGHEWQNMSYSIIHDVSTWIKFFALSLLPT